MNWLENNPLGAVLAGFCVTVLLASAALGFVWSRPASSGVASSPGQQSLDGPEIGPAYDLGPISAYKGVNDRPLFAESRRPTVSIDVDEEGVVETVVADAPRVALTGVVITPEQRIVTMRPEGGGESIIVGVNQSMGEQYPGWSVSGIDSRSIVLTSRNGDSLELDLAIHKQTIAEPPKPEPVDPGAARAESDGDAPAEGDQPLSRAEEIRQRIAERREELRRQAEQEENQKEQAASRYQDAIRTMMGRRNNENEDEEKSDKDGNGN